MSGKPNFTPARPPRPEPLPHEMAAPSAPETAPAAPSAQPSPAPPPASISAPSGAPQEAPWAWPPSGFPWAGSYRRQPRPEWWPEGEPWPPKRHGSGWHGGWNGGGWHGGGWHDARYSFLRRVGCFFAVVVGLMIAASILGAIFWDERGGRNNYGDGEGGPGFFGVLVLLAIVFFVFRAVRRTAAPIGDVMAAADRVAGGDYGVRVEARASGEVKRLVGSFNAMTARLQANEEQRRNLLADVAHELRTPLSVIRGTVEGMLDGVYPRDDERLGAVLEETAVMARLLDDLRTLSLAEAGALRLRREPTDLGELVADLVAGFEARADEAGIAVLARVDPLPPLSVDPVRLRQVLDNLLSNALRHTPRGGSVAIEARSELSTSGGAAAGAGAVSGAGVGGISGGSGRGAAGAGAAVAITVRDTGSGIPAEHLPHVFDRFWKSADSGGSGLGLAIAKGLVEAHGGTIAADSAPGRGTTIRLTLPRPVIV